MANSPNALLRQVLEIYRSTHPAYMGTRVDQATAALRVPKITVPSAVEFTRTLGQWGRMLNQHGIRIPGAFGRPEAIVLAWVEGSYNDTEQRGYLGALNRTQSRQDGGRFVIEYLADVLKGQLAQQYINGQLAHETELHLWATKCELVGQFKAEYSRYLPDMQRNMPVSHLANQWRELIQNVISVEAVLQKNGIGFGTV
jgi:hypothetical protein